MRSLFAAHIGSPRRILLIESAPREAAEQALLNMYRKPETQLVDVLSCYSEPPKGFDAHRGSAYFVHSNEAVSNRWGFIRSLSAAPYDTIAMVSAGSSVMRNWKWAIALRSSARLLLIDEFGESMPLSIREGGSFWRILVYRSNLASAATLFLAAVRLGMLPLIMAYLVAYGAVAHVRRWARLPRLAMRQSRG